MVIPCYKMMLFMLLFSCSYLPVTKQTKSAGWTKKQADIFFVVDGSSSVWIVDFNISLKFVYDLVSYMDISPTTTRVGVGVYSDTHMVHIPINNNYVKEQLKNQIMRTPYLKGNAYLSRALKGLREQGLARSIVRQQVPLIAVLLTDGTSRHKQLTADNATLVKKEGIFIFTIGIGNAVDKDELRKIASDPKLTFNYHVPDFNHLSELTTQLSISMSEVEMLQGDEGTCGDKVKVDTVFVFDEADVGGNDTHKIKVFIQAVVDNFSVNSGNVRVGIVSKTCHEGDIVLGQYVTKADLFAGLQNNDGPGISELLKRVRQTSFLPENGARSDAKRRIVLILHANVSKRTETMREAHRAKYAGIEIFVIRLGNDYEKPYINSLASKESYTMYPGTADDLLKKESKQMFSRTFCEEL